MSRPATRRSTRPSAPRRVSGPAGRAASTAAGAPQTSSGRGTRLGDAVRGAVATRSGAATAAAIAVPAPAPRPRPRAVPTPAPRRPTRGASPFVEHLRALPDLALLDGLLRSRAWIVLLGIALGGIVAMQVSLLGMNAGISEAVVKTTALEQDQATLQEQISELSDGERIRAGASKDGLALPSAGDVGYLTARADADARLAAAGITPPSDIAKGVLAATASSDTLAGQTSSAQLVAPGVAAAAAADPAAPDPDATADGTTAAPPAATPAPATAAPDTTTDATTPTGTTTEATAPVTGTTTGATESTG